MFDFKSISWFGKTENRCGVLIHETPCKKKLKKHQKRCDTHEKEYRLSHRAYHLFYKSHYTMYPKYRDIPQRILAQVELNGRKRHREKFLLNHDEGHEYYERVYLRPILTAYNFFYYFKNEYKSLDYLDVDTSTVLDFSSRVDKTCSDINISYC